MSDNNSKQNRAVWFDIPVGDLDRAATFYRAVLSIDVHKIDAGAQSFCVLHHDEGNGGCLVLAPSMMSSNGGILVYLNTDGRIRDAVAKAEGHGGKIVEPVRCIGPHGFRAIVLDSEGNRIALHSATDG